MAEEKISKIYSRRRFVILAYKNRKKNNNSSYSGWDDSVRYNTGGHGSGRSAIGKHKKRKMQEDFCKENHLKFFNESVII